MLHDPTCRTRVHASTKADALRLRNAAGCQGIAEQSCLIPFVPPPPALTGDFGILPAPPRLVGAYIEDYDNLDAEYSANDTIIVRFSEPTNYFPEVAFAMFRSRVSKNLSGSSSSSPL